MGFRPSHYQEAIFEWARTGEGNARVGGVAGCGKSTTLELLWGEIDSMSVLSCAFNVSAKKTLERKAKKVAPWVKVKTMNGIGHGAIAGYYSDYNWKELDLDVNKYRTIASDMVDAAIRADSGPSVYLREERYASIAVLNYLCDITRKTLTNPDDEAMIRELIAHYGVKQLVEPDVIDWAIEQMPIICDRGLEMVENLNAQKQRVLDFTDQLWVPYVSDLQCPQYEWVLGDECQDFSKAQQELLLKSVKKGGRVIVVGDPHQAIYGFAGADSESWDNLELELGSVDLPLSICYRCPTSHIELAQTIVPHIEARPDAPEGVLASMKYGDVHRNVKRGDLILCRTNAPLVGMCFHLIRNNIGAKIIGNDISPALIGTINKIEKQKGFSFNGHEEDEEGFAYWTGRYRAKQSEKIMRKNGWFADDPGIAWINDICDALIVIHDMLEDPRSTYDLEGVIKRLFSDKEDHTVVQLSSVHRAKGMEANRVFIIRDDPRTGMPLMPHPNASKEWQIEQEYNLMYVAFTRAKEEMYFVIPDMTVL